VHRASVHPVYILPLVEIVGGRETSDECTQKASEFMASMGMKPLICPVEADAFIADRLQTAIWRECLWMVNDNIATTQQLDDAIRFGPGLRWAMMGQCFIYYLAGGERGMRHFLEQFGPALKLPWCHMEAPELTDELIEKFVSQTGEQAGEESFRELEALRDNCLISIMEALSEYEYAAGKVLAEDSRRQNDRISGE
jgi:carnitine 3-dehydrogenase